MNRMAGLACISAALFVVFGSARASMADTVPTGYRVKWLGNLPSNQPTSIAYAVNDHGVVVGRSSFGETIPHGFIWDSSQGMRDLGDLPGGLDLSIACDVNNLGQVVGYSEAATGYRAFLWDEQSGLTNLGDLPGGSDFSTARGINDRGQIVGRSKTASGNRAFLWDAANGMQSLSYAFAWDINESGQVAGQGLFGNALHALLWTPGTGVRDLGPLPPTNRTSGKALNDVGQVVGSSSRDPTGGRAFYYSDATGMIDIAGGQNGRADDISPSGVVVGWHEPDNTSGQRAFVWGLSSGLQDLNGLLVGADPGWILYAAHGINSGGQIVGTGLGPSGNQEAFLLTPVPLPASAWLGLGLLALLGAARRIRRRR